MKPFNHVDAKTITEAVELLRSNQGRAKLIAGGTDLLSTLKDKILPAYPETVINIKNIPGLDYVHEEDDAHAEPGLGHGHQAEVVDHPPVLTQHEVGVALGDLTVIPAIQHARRLGKGRQHQPVPRGQHLLIAARRRPLRSDLEEPLSRARDRRPLLHRAAEGQDVASLDVAPSVTS